jgi:hypothetical protein
MYTYVHILSLLLALALSLLLSLPLSLLCVSFLTPPSHTTKNYRSWPR